jgi:hypothetical protein
VQTRLHYLSVTGTGALTDGARPRTRSVHAPISPSKPLARRRPRPAPAALALGGGAIETPPRDDESAEVVAAP